MAKHSGEGTGSGGVGKRRGGSAHRTRGAHKAQGAHKAPTKAELKAAKKAAQQAAKKTEKAKKKPGITDTARFTRNQLDEFGGETPGRGVPRSRRRRS